MKSLSIVDLLERVGWTFAQALAGSIAAGGTAVSLQTFDWRAALVGAGTAAALCLLKVIAVAASASNGQTGALLNAAVDVGTVVADEVEHRPVVEPAPVESWLTLPPVEVAAPPVKASVPAFEAQAPPEPVVSGQHALTEQLPIVTPPPPPPPPPPAPPAPPAPAALNPAVVSAAGQVTQTVAP